MRVSGFLFSKGASKKDRTILIKNLTKKDTVVFADLLSDIPGSCTHKVF